MSGSRRDEVLAVAARLFEEKGYRATSIEDLTNAMGFTKAAIYYYVKSKQELLEQLAHKIGSELLDFAFAEADTSVSPGEQLRVFARHHVAAVAANRAVFTVTTRERSELSADILADLERLERQYVARLTDLVGRQPSTRRHRAPASVASHVLLGMLASVVDWYRPGEGLTPDDVADLIVDLFLNGIAARRTASPSLRSVELPAPSPAVGVDEKGRREEIVAAAADLFHTKGYEATTMQDIADVLGVTKAALYYYVSGKQELLQELLLRIGYGLLDAARAVIDGQPAARAFAALVRLHLGWIHEERTLFSLFLLSRSALDEAAFAELRKGEREYVDLYRRLLDQGISAGAFRRIDGGVFLPALLGSLNATLRWFHADGALSVEGLADVVDDVVFRGYAPER
jgi:AcrR family transcriptional regulator